jgi:UDP-glucose 4-epimerase
MRALVTGAAGFIGSTLVDRLLGDGHQVVGIDNLSTGYISNLEAALCYAATEPRRFTFLRLDVQAPELADVVAGTNPDVIFHLAAHVNLPASVADPQFDARSNVLGTINICEAARRSGIARIVYAASGGSRYGAAGSSPIDESGEADPYSPYAAAKVAGELYMRAYARMYGLAPISLALANVFGPRQNSHGEAGAVMSFGAAMISGRPAMVNGDATAGHDYVYVDDAVDALVRAGHAPAGVGGTYNIGTGRLTDLVEIHRLIAAALDGSPRPVFGAGDPGEPPAVALDAGKAQHELGWQPQVELAEGIQRTVRWLCAMLKRELPLVVTA